MRYGRAAGFPLEPAVGGEPRPSGPSEPSALAQVWALLLLAAFCVLLVAAALAYPGGSWDDHAATRFHWLWNYWCDLIREQAWNGAPNGTARLLAQASSRSR